MCCLPSAHGSLAGADGDTVITRTSLNCNLAYGCVGRQALCTAGEPISHICGPLMSISEMTDILTGYSLPLSRSVELGGGIQYVKHQPEKTSN